MTETVNSEQTGVTSALPEAETPLNNLLAFQPIFARNMDVKAFALVLEKGSTHWEVNDLQVLNHLIVESYTSIYQQGQLETLPCVLKLTEQHLLDDSLPDLPRNQYILEVDGGEALSPEAHERLEELAGKGYLLVLSNYRAEREDLAALLRIVHIIRLDMSRLSAMELDVMLTRLKPHGLDLFADHLPDSDSFRLCVDQGFQYFRGDFLGKPESVKGKIPGNNKLVLLQLLAELDNPLPNLEQLEQIIIGDSSLTYKFLKAANSATYGISREIETLHQALAILGLKQIRRWLSLFLLEVEEGKPRELIRRSLIRGRMCEIIAELTNRHSPISYFFTGLLSQLDTVTGVSMEDLMSHVSLNQDIKSALLSRKGEMGDILTEVEHYEQGNFDHLSMLSERSFYEIAYRHSNAWARQLLMSQQD